MIPLLTARTLLRALLSTWAPAFWAAGALTLAALVGWAARGFVGVR